jgi:hypothetical protein
MLQLRLTARLAILISIVIIFSLFLTKKNLVLFAEHKAFVINYYQTTIKLLDHSTTLARYVCLFIPALLQFRSGSRCTSNHWLVLSGHSICIPYVC